MPSHTIPNEAATKYHVSSESTTWFARLHFAKTRVGGSDDVQVLSSESGSKPKEAPRTGEPGPQRRVESPTINMTLPFQDGAQDYDVTIRSKSTQLNSFRCVRTSSATSSLHRTCHSSLSWNMPAVHAGNLAISGDNRLSDPHCSQPPWRNILPMTGH